MPARSRALGAEGRTQATKQMISGGDSAVEEKREDVDVRWKQNYVNNGRVTLFVVAVGPLALNRSCIAFVNNQSSDILTGARNGP